MIFKQATITAGMSLGTALRLIVQNGVGLRPVFLFRLFVIVSMGLWTSILGGLVLPFRSLFCARRPLRPDPVFIVGHWRTGSTYLHELLALDKRFSAPTTLLCSAPAAYPLSLLFIKPLMYLTSFGKRPMDNVFIGPNSPQEDEFALFRLTGESPVKGLVYPRKGDRFFIEPEAVSPTYQHGGSRWRRGLKFVLLAAQGVRGRRPLLKNPFHSFRIKELIALCPEATFIHLQRNPEHVIPSTIRMWNVVAKYNILKGRWPELRCADVLPVYRALEDAVKTTLESVPERRKTTVAFASLEADPVTTLKGIYDKLHWTVTDELEARWRRYAGTKRHFEKNIYTLSDEDRRSIREQTSTKPR